MKYLKHLPENFTDEEHAAWIRQMDREEKRSEIISKVIVYGIIGAFLLYVYLTGDKQKQDSMWWLIVVGFIAYQFEQRLNTIVEKLEAIEQKLGLR